MSQMDANPYRSPETATADDHTGGEVSRQADHLLQLAQASRLAHATFALPIAVGLVLATICAFLMSVAPGLALFLGLISLVVVPLAAIPGQIIVTLQLWRLTSQNIPVVLSFFPVVGFIPIVQGVREAEQVLREHNVTLGWLGPPRLEIERLLRSYDQAVLEESGSQHTHEPSVKTNSAARQTSPDIVST